MISPSLLLPLAAALLYVLGALLVKRAADFGVGGWRTAFVSNCVSALLFQGLLPLGGSFHLERLWQPALVGVFFLLGQLLNYLALERGDVSVATPVLGVKILLVAFFTALFLEQGVTPRLAAAAAASSLAIALLGWSGGGRHHHVARTIALAGGSASMFALADVFVQKWAPAWGVGRFLPAMLGCVAVLSLALLPFLPAPLTTIPRRAWSWLLAGCTFVGLQSALFGASIAVYGHATAANVLYSSRGLWSVALVWTIGHWFESREQQLGARVLRWRLAGAASMLAAIALVVFE